MAFTEINTSEQSMITIWHADKSNEVEFEIDNSDRSVSVWVNEITAKQIINTLKEQFDL